MKIEFDSEKGDYVLFTLSILFCCLMLCVTIYNVVLVCVKGQEPSTSEWTRSEKASK